MRLLLVLVHTILMVVSGVFTSKSHPVTTLLNAKWHATPVCLEIAEYLADESSNAFWDYVTELNKLKTPLYEIDTDSKAYKASLAAAEKLIGPIQLSLLKLSLSMHTLSPRVQAHFQIAQEVIRHGDCETTAFVTIGSRVACNVNELKKGLKKAATPSEAPSTDGDVQENEEDEEVYSFDHIYPGSENNTITTVLYGQLGSKDFSEFHDFLVKRAEKSQVKYIARHYIRVSLATSRQMTLVAKIISFMVSDRSHRITAQLVFACPAMELSYISSRPSTKVRTTLRLLKMPSPPN